MKIRASGCFSAFALIVVGLFLAYILHPLWLPLVGRALDVKSNIHKVDVIIVLGGGAGDREQYASELYRQGLAPNVIATGAPVGTESEAIGLVTRGVPRGAIVLANGTQNTRGDSLRTRQIMEERGWRTGLLVTDPYHARRSLWTFRTTLAGTALEVSPAPVVDGWFSADHWWQTEDGFVAVDEEYIKLVYYLLRGYVSPSAITEK